MAISWDTLTKAKAADLPPRILIYGPEKMGKTSLACEFPNPIFLRIECGPPEGVELPGWDIQHLSEFLEALSYLYDEDHDFKTLVIDSISALERKVIWPRVCEVFKGDKGETVDHIEGFGFGRGYRYALDIWNDVLERLNSLRRDCGMTILLIGHSTVRDFKDPESQAYSVYDVALQHAEKVSAADRVKQEVDAILFIKPKVSVEKEDPKDTRNRRVIAKGGAARWICAEKRAAYSAGNRYSIPDEIPYRQGEGFTELAGYISALEQYLPVKTQKAA